MEPRLRNSSGPVEAMPKHKQAGHTTVLTKYAQTPKKTLAIQEPPTQDIRAGAQHFATLDDCDADETAIHALITNDGFWAL